jgi:hypothetical protein
MHRTRIAAILVVLATLAALAAPVSAGGGGIGFKVFCVGSNVGVSYFSYLPVSFSTNPSASVVKTEPGYIEYQGPFSGTITGMYKSVTDIHTASLPLEFTVSISCGEAGIPQIQDGRENPYDIAAPVVVYLKDGFVEIYAIDPANSEGVLWKKMGFADYLKFPVSTPAEPGLSGDSPTTGRNISVYHLEGRKFQVNTFYADGKEYVFRFELPPSS